MQKQNRQKTTGNDLSIPLYKRRLIIAGIRVKRKWQRRILCTLNRFKSPPNLDIGEDVDRMFKVMMEHNLYEPLYLQPYIRPNSVLLFFLNLQRIEYWDTVSKYLDEQCRITNTIARKFTGINDTLKVSVC